MWIFPKLEKKKKKKQKLKNWLGWGGVHIPLLLKKYTQASCIICFKDLIKDGLSSVVSCWYISYF